MHRANDPNVWTLGAAPTADVYIRSGYRRWCRRDERAGWIAMHVSYMASAAGGPKHVIYKALDGQQGVGGLAQAGRSGGRWCGGQGVRDRAAAVHGHVHA